MPDLLLELRSEEIPARMQRKAAGDLKKAVTDALVDSGLTYEAAREYWTPRRLALDVRGLTATLGRHPRGAQGPAHRRAGKGGRGLPARRRAGLGRRGGGPFRPEEGRFLRRRDRKARPPRRGDHRRGDARHHPRLPLAEIDALGRGLRHEGSPMAASRAGDRKACAGCARCSRSSAPSGPRPRSRSSSISRSTASAPATSPTATASTRRSRSPCAASTTMRTKLEKA